MLKNLFKKKEEPDVKEMIRASAMILVRKLCVETKQKKADLTIEMTQNKKSMGAYKITVERV